MAAPSHTDGGSRPATVLRVSAFLQQLPALIGVVIGALGSYLAVSLGDRARYRRDTAARWRDRRLTTYVAFQQVPDYQPPRWPGPGCPQRLHLDVMVDDLDVAEPQVLALGAELLEASDKPIGWRMYADPAGHPFCLTTN